MVETNKIRKLSFEHGSMSMVFEELELTDKGLETVLETVRLGKA